ncbi:hypothetical protein [Streptomyces silvensis]|uniref:hypothetical protein n=1 Tax=Streptomyces silvensis TaxID=1765722 RepID=UPI000ABA9D89|nr:hypothetical protein [Streptomyces silvensis]
MTDITQITIALVTADVAGAATQGRIYLGLAGREFLLANTDRIARNGDNQFVLGEGGNVANADHNDPRRPQLDTADLDRYPAYIRLRDEGGDPGWCLEQVCVAVNPRGAVRHQFSNPRLEGMHTDGARIWLSDDCGTRLHLRRGGLGS